MRLRSEKLRKITMFMYGNILIYVLNTQISIHLKSARPEITTKNFNEV